MNNQELIRVVIKEELVLMTRHRDEALILNQLLYWTPKTKSFRKFIEEEKSGEATTDFGWIYKKAEDLKEELLMVDTNVKTVRKYLNSLVEKGYLLRRRNPFNKYDKTYQYRVNMKQIVCDLNFLGYEVVGIEKFFEYKNAIKKSSFENNDEDSRLGNTEMTKIPFEEDNLDVGVELSHFGKSEMPTAIPEINTEIINKEYISNKEIKKENDSTVNLISFKQIEDLYLQLSNEKFLKDNDKQHITALLASDIEINLVVELMKQCHAQVQKNKNHPGIYSFYYFKNFIERALKQQKKQAMNTHVATLNESLEFIGDTIVDF